MLSPHGQDLKQALLAGLLFFAYACGEPTPETLDPLDSASGGNVSGTSPYEYEGDGADETAAPVEYYDGCLRFPESPQGLPGVRHQCGGLVTARVHFDAVGVGQFNGAHTFPTILEFGHNESDDSYNKPKVMACCKPIEDQTLPWEGPQLNSCYHDLVENACASTVSRILSLKDYDEVPSIAYPQINALAEWFATAQETCYEEFWRSSGAETFFPEQIPFTTLPDSFPSHTWDLPSSAETNNIKNIQLEFDTPWIASAWLPSSTEDWLECYSQHENHDVSFVEAGPDAGTVAELYMGSASLSGPDDPVRGRPTGSATLDSISENCDLCSYMSFIPGSETFESLVLDSAEPAPITWGSSTATTVDRFRIALYAPARAEEQSSNVYEVPARGALFVVVADAEGSGWSLTGYNKDAFNIEHFPSVGSWVVEGFVIEYTDISSDIWEMEVSESIFEE